MEELRSGAPPDQFRHEAKLAEALKAGKMMMARKQASDAPRQVQSDFDAYYQWLGIPPDEQPPNHYRLLGIKVFEANADVIDMASERQIRHVRSFQAGKHSRESQRLLNELARARLCLLNEDDKAAYDARLRRELPQDDARSGSAGKAADGVRSWTEGKPPRTVREMVSCLITGGLMTAEEIKKFVAGLPAAERPGDAKGLADVVTRRGRLTMYQGLAVSKGHTKGLVFGEHEILEPIGKGGMGEVFRARHRHLERDEAVKVVASERLDSPEAVARFEQEAKAAAKLMHENIVATYDAGQQEGVHYLAMEYVDGRDLSQIVDNEGPLSVEQAIDYVIQAARGLAYAHQRGIIHRDIKPSNLLLAIDDQPSAVGGEEGAPQSAIIKILDMGLARLTEDVLRAARGEETERLTKTGQLMGTLDYMSPEQAEDFQAADQRSDIYSLGCTLHKLLTGDPVYDADTSMRRLLAHRDAPIPSLRECGRNIPTELDAVFQKMVAKNPNDRYQSMDELITALTASRTPAPPVIVASGPPRHRRSRSTAVSKLKKPDIGRWAEIARSWPVVQTALRHRRVTAIAVGVVAAFFLMAAVVLTFRTPMGEIEVVLDEGVADSVEIVLTRGGKELIICRVDQWTIRLVEGEYRVDVKGRENRFEIAENTVRVVRGEKAIVKVSVAEKPTETPALAKSPFNAEQGKRHQQEWARHLGMPVEMTNSIGMKLTLIPPGEFMMGSPESEEGRSDNEYQHRVRITNAFYIGVYEVTQAEYEKVMGSNPSKFSAVAGHDTNRFPVEMVSWEDAVEFCRKLSALPGKERGSRVYRLPTEAEWEYACRAGTSSTFCFGDSLTSTMANINGENPYGATVQGPNLQRTTGVGSYKPNAWGVHDMHGNVWEWCRGWYDDDYYRNSPVEDPPGPSQGTLRVMRGGTFFGGGVRCRSACRGPTRGKGRMDYGFRVVCEMPASVASSGSTGGSGSESGTLARGQWHDVLRLIDLDRHAINGKWLRKADGVWATPAITSRLVVPVRVQSDYDIDFSFTRHSGNEAVFVNLPIADLASCTVGLSFCGGGVSGFHYLGGKFGWDHPSSHGVVRPGTIQNGKRYRATVRVRKKGAVVSIDVRLDGKPYFKWEGKADLLERDSVMTLPRSDMLAIGAHVVDATFHEVRLRPLSAAAQVWPWRGESLATKPPKELQPECVQWNGHWYWMSDEKMPFSKATALAEKHGGRLLCVSSDAENDFVVKQWPYRDIWLNAFRNGAELNRRTAWMDDTLEPLTYYGPWGHRQPGAHWNEMYLGIHGVDACWHDRNDNDELRACIEWGDENRSPQPESAVVVGEAARPPREFRLAANGLADEQHVDPVLWCKDWIEPDSFAHIRGKGEIAYPKLPDVAFGLDLDFTAKPSRGALNIHLGDMRDANLWIPIDVGLDKKKPETIRYKVFDWINGGRWTVGHVESKTGERNRISVVVKESKLGIIRDGRRVHHGDTELVDAMLRIVSHSPDLDVVIHSAQLRPLTEEDCRIMGWKMPRKTSNFDAAKAKLRIDKAREGLATKPEAGKSFLVPTTQTVMKWVAPGSFAMGEKPKDEPSRHKVQISKGFWMGVFEVTQGEWMLMMSENPSRVTGSPHLPVDCVTYTDALRFCTELTKKERSAGRLPAGLEYRLPTEAEWGYCCRAGREVPYKAPNEETWSTGGTGWRPQQVGEAEPNPWGIFDMAGNVTEWCLDAWHNYPAEFNAVRVDPFTPPRHWTERYIVRGGTCWRSNEKVPWERTSHSSVPGGYRGFRVVLGTVLTHQIPETVKNRALARKGQTTSGTNRTQRVSSTPASSVPAAGERLKLGTWYDVLSLVDVERHGLYGPWIRTDEGVVALAQPSTTLVIPVVLRGDYELAVSFTRYGWQDGIHVDLPVGSASRTSLGFGIWANKMSGLSRVGGKWLPSQPMSSAVRRPGGIDGYHRYQAVIRVTTKEDTATIAVQLDGRPYLTWSGSTKDLGLLQFRNVPGQDMLGIGVHEVATAFHEVRLKMLSGEAQRWSPDIARAAPVAPEELHAACTTWKGRRYWISREAVDFGEALTLAARYQARLLRISSREEHEFITSTWKGRNIWLGAWRQGGDPNRHTGWLDDRLEKVDYFHTWDEGNPNGYRGEDSLCIVGRRGLWHDSVCDYRCYVVLEWGEE